MPSYKFSGLRPSRAVSVFKYAGGKPDSSPVLTGTTEADGSFSASLPKGEYVAETAGPYSRSAGGVLNEDDTVSPASSIEFDDAGLVSVSGRTVQAALEAVDGALGSGTSRTVIKAADETINNSNTVQDDNELTMAVAANEVWVGKFTLWVENSASVTPHFRIKVTAPAGASVRYGAVGNRATDYLRQDAAYQSSAAVSVFTRGTTGAKVEVEFWVSNGATAGSITLQWAQDVATAENTTVKAGSSLVAFRQAA